MTGRESIRIRRWRRTARTQSCSFFCSGWRRTEAIRDWLESCDEAERLGIYKASYKSFQVMNSLCPVMEAAALLGKIMFDTGNFPIILVTFLWAVQTGVYCFYSAQYDRRGAGE